MYEYQPLPEQDSIRILILAPGKDNDPLSGTLDTTHVNNRQQTLHSAQRAPKQRKTSPAAQLPRWTAGRPFEAISYAWGSNMLDHAILLNGMAHQITANLNDALRQCRLPDQPRALWADSICINQNDLKEKGQQVAVMDRVYASSRCTLICLGTDTDNRDHARDAFEVLSDANTMIQQALQSPGFSWELNSFPWPTFQDPLVRDSRWQSIKIMVDLPWFWRGWVVQEAALGREARILWAGCEIPLLDLMRVELWFNRRVRELAGTSNHVSWWITKLVRQTLVHQRRAEARVFYDSECLMEDMDILETLDGARNLGLGDPRDRIYAFMALPFVKNPMPALRPDYEQSHLRLYRDFAVKYLEHTSDLNILCYVTHEVDDGQGPDSLESSWVPRWDHRNWVTSVRIIGQGYRFCSDSADSADFAIVHKNDLAPVLLKVRAVVFGLVGFVSQRFMQHSTAEDLTRVWSLASEGIPRASGREESDTFHDSLAFLQALSFGTFSGPSQEDWDDSLKSYSRLLQNSVQVSRSSQSCQVSAGVQFCHSNLMFTSVNARLFMLERGYYGLGPWTIETSDVCAFIFGVQTPLILRRVPGEDDRYKLIGPAFVVSKQLNEKGVPKGLHFLSSWKNWRELCDLEGWTNWGLKVEDIILQ